MLEQTKNNKVSAAKLMSVFCLMIMVVGVFSVVRMPQIAVIPVSLDQLGTCLWSLLIGVNVSETAIFVI